MSCFVAATTAPVFESTTRRYPHQLDASAPPHSRCGADAAPPLPRSQVLKATQYIVSASAQTAASAKMRPASLHPRHPGHSTKFARTGFPSAAAASRIDAIDIGASRFR